MSKLELEDMLLDESTCHTVCTILSSGSRCIADNSYGPQVLLLQLTGSVFLAPISAFDQTLAEDPRTNRLEDSMLLWRSVVMNRLIADVNIVLFLNKCDLLKAKLEGGVQLAYHMVSYGDRPNDYEAVSTCTLSSSSIVSS